MIRKERDDTNPDASLVLGTSNLLSSLLREDLSEVRTRVLVLCLPAVPACSSHFGLGVVRPAGDLDLCEDVEDHDSANVHKADQHDFCGRDFHSILFLSEECNLVALRIRPPLLRSCLSVTSGIRRSCACLRRCFSFFSV